MFAPRTGSAARARSARVAPVAVGLLLVGLAVIFSTGRAGRESPTLTPRSNPTAASAPPTTSVSTTYRSTTSSLTATPPTAAGASPTPIPTIQPAPTNTSPWSRLHPEPISAQGLLDGPPAEAELHRFPLMPGARDVAGDNAHLLTFKSTSPIGEVETWYAAHLRAEGYDVQTSAMPELSTIRGLAFATHSGRVGSIVIRADQTGGPGSGILVVIP